MEWWPRNRTGGTPSVRTTTGGLQWLSTQHPQTTGESAGYEDYANEERGYGGVVFAGVLLLIAGTLNTVEGIAAIGNANFFVHNTHYVVGSLKTWGWIVLCIGVIELAVGLGVFAKNNSHAGPACSSSHSTASRSC